MDRRLKIVFVGMPDMAYVCLSNMLAKKFNILCVVPPNKSHNTYPAFIQYVESQGLKVINFNKNPNEPDCINTIKELNADIGVVCSYNYKLSKDFLSTTRLGYINCHPSILPDYRGAMPYFHIIKNAEKISGITLHFMDEDFDTGDIVYQEKFELLPWETMGTLFNRTNYMISDALIKILSDYENGIDFKRIPQPKDSRYIQAPKTEGNLKIRWNKKASEISSLIKACNPFFNAFTNFRKVPVKIIKAHPVKYSHNLEFGQIAKVDEKNLFIATGEGCLSVEILQLSSWGIFNTQEFYYTFTPTTNEFFE